VYWDLRYAKPKRTKPLGGLVITLPLIFENELECPAYGLDERKCPGMAKKNLEKRYSRVRFSGVLAFSTWWMLLTGP
jgi:hypothetical protein